MVSPLDVLAGKRILICEDEGVIILHFTRALERAEMVIVGEARTGTESIRLAIETAPDVILMDVTLNDGIDGIEASRQILATRPNVCIVGVSGSSEATIERALDAGMRGFIKKPIESQSLIDELARILDGCMPAR